MILFSVFLASGIGIIILNVQDFEDDTTCQTRRCSLEGLRCLKIVFYTAFPNVVFFCTFGQVFLYCIPKHSFFSVLSVKFFCTQAQTIQSAAWGDNTGRCLWDRCYIIGISGLEADKMEIVKVTDDEGYNCIYYDESFDETSFSYTHRKGVQLFS